MRLWALPPLPMHKKRGKKRAKNSAKTLSKFLRICPPRFIHSPHNDWPLHVMSNAKTPGTNSFRMLRSSEQQGLSKQKAQVVEALHRIERMGDPGAEDALLRERNRRVREKRGLKEG